MADRNPPDWRSDASLPAPYDEPFRGNAPELRAYRPYDITSATRADHAKRVGQDPMDLVQQGYSLDQVYGPDTTKFNAAERFLTTPGGQAVMTLAGVMGPGVKPGARAPKLPMDPASRESRALAWEGYAPGTRWYHGGNRIDRVVEKGKLDPRRASSGPMPYFTDEPQIASNYAVGKPDVSRFDDGDISRYFTVSPKDMGLSGRAPYTVEQSWHFLSPEKRAEIADKVLRVGYENPDMADGPYTLHDGFGSLSGPDHYKYILDREARGNHLKALRMLWHDGGSLIGSEHEMADIWKLAGYPHPISQYNAPWTQHPGILPARLSMKNPLVTTSVEELKTKVIPALEEAFKKDRTRLKEHGNDDWDKNTRYTPKTWLARLKEDLVPDARTGTVNNSYAWTSIPDKVTDVLRRLGYDGIVDVGGKGAAGEHHRVAIPFAPHQVRAAYGAAFDPAKAHSDRLLDSRLLPFGGAALGAAALGAYAGVEAQAAPADLKPYEGK